MLICTAGIEAVLYDCYESACMMSLLWGVKKNLILCFLWSGCHDHCMY